MGKKRNKHSFVKKASTWNNIPNKPKNVAAIAKEGDIVMKLNQVWFLLQRENEINNIVCFRQEGKWRNGIDTIRAMFDFCYKLRCMYGIKYIRVSGKKYNFIDRLFPNDSVRASDDVCSDAGEVVRYIHLSDRLVAMLGVLRNGGK